MELLELYKNLAEERKKVLDHTEKLLIEKEKEIERLRNMINEKCYNIENNTNTNKKYILIFKIAEESFKFINKTITIKYINTTCDNIQMLNEFNNESNNNQTIFITLSNKKMDVVDIIKDMLSIKIITIKVTKSSIDFNRKRLSDIIRYLVNRLQIEEECTLFKNDNLFRINIDQDYIKKELEKYLVYIDRAYRSLMFVQQSLCYEFKKTTKHISNEDLVGCKLFDLNKNYLGIIRDVIIDETKCLILYDE